MDTIRRLQRGSGDEDLVVVMMLRMMRMVVETMWPTLKGAKNENFNSHRWQMPKQIRNGGQNFDLEFAAKRN